MSNAELVARLEGGETGREIDAEIACHFRIGEGGNLVPDARLTWKREGGSVVVSGFDKRIATMTPAPFTSNLGFAAALVKIVRPGIKRSLTWNEEGADARLDWHADYCDDSAPTPAAALVAALLRTTPPEER